MTDHQLTAADLLLEAAAELQRCPETGNWPSTWRSPSQKRMHRPDLVREVNIVWLLPESEARQLAWARERFGKLPRNPKGLIARSVDGRGRTVRYWVCRPEDQHAYQHLLQAGAGTAPIEAVWPPSIAVGMPALPAHPFLTPELWANIAADEGNPVALPRLELDPAAEATKLIEIERAFWEGLRPEREVSHG